MLPIKMLEWNRLDTADKSTFPPPHKRILIERKALVVDSHGVTHVFREFAERSRPNHVTTLLRQEILPLSFVHRWALAPLEDAHEREGRK